MNRTASLIAATAACGILPAAMLAADKGEKKAPVVARRVQNLTPLATGKVITPQGVQVNVGSFPCSTLVSPDGRYMVVTNTGYRQFLTVLRMSDGTLVSQVQVGRGARPKEGLYYGLAWGPLTQEGFTLYASRGAEGRVAVHNLDAEGKLSPAVVTMKLNTPEAGAEKSPYFFAGMAANSTGSRLFIANNIDDTDPLRGSLTILDTAQGLTPPKANPLPLPGYPLAVAALTAGPDADKKVYVTSERDAVVSVVDVSDKTGDYRVRDNVKVGASPMHLTLNRAQTRLYVANAGSDTVSVLDTKTDRVVQTILVRPDDARGLPGATPTSTALSPDETRLYVTLADLNAVAVVSIPDGKLLGMIPVGWYPTSVQVAGDGRTLYIANAKGVNARNPNRVTPDAPAAEKSAGYIQTIIEGTVSRLTAATGDELNQMTGQPLANNRLGAINGEAVRAFKNPGIEHIIYIVKENRTYDQVLGDLPQGNGDPDLVMFGRAVTPNQHALVERFALLDNFYCAAEVSADGWNWSTSGMANEYTARNTPYNYSGRGRTYDFEGQNNNVPVDHLKLPDVATAPGGYIWDAVIKRGLPMRNYGFFVSFTDPATRDKEGKPDAKVRNNYPNKRSLEGKTDLNFKQYDMTYADSDLWVKYDCPAPNQTKAFGEFNAPSRFSAWKREFDGFVKSGKMPRFMTVRFGRDHTSGTSPGAPTPAACVADNDYAVGQLVEAVSNSPFWKKTAIFIVEDDAQNGFDHVDAHRSTAYVISPFVKKSVVDSRFYNTDSTLHTMCRLLGAAPMNQVVASAPLLDVFADAPLNDAPYTAVLPAREIAAAVNQRTAYRANDSRRLLNPLKEDATDDDDFNDILWHGVMGKNTPKPAIRYGLRLNPERDEAKDEDEDEERAERKAQRAKAARNPAPVKKRK